MNPRVAANTAVETVRLWARAARATKIIVAITGAHNFRSLVLPSYKMNRKGVRKPVALSYTKRVLRDTFQTVLVDGLEADDLMGMMATSPTSKGKKVIVTVDKDLRGVPGLFLNPTKDDGIEWVSEADANRFWVSQALTGDTSDGYVGCPGIGPKKAETILSGWDGKEAEDALELLVPVFAARLKVEPFQAREEAVRQLRVSRILRAGDYDKEKREVRLWGSAEPRMVSLETLIGGNG